MPSSSVEPIGTLSPSTLSGSPAWMATFSTDGRYLAVCFGNPNTHVKVWKFQPPPTTSTSLQTSNINSSEEEWEPIGVNNAHNTTTRKEEDVSKQWKLITTISEEHTRTIRSVAFAPTSSTLGVPILATASFDGKVLIWECYPDIVNGKNDEYDDEDCTNNNNLFEPIAQLEGHENEIKCLAWNTTGSLLASCGRDKTIWIWECYLPGTVGGVETSNINNGLEQQQQEDGGEFECLAVLQGHDGDVKCIVFGPSHSQWGEGDEVLYSASYDNTIKIWAEESGDWYCAATLGGGNSTTMFADVHTSTVWSLGLTNSGVRLFSGCDDGGMAIWKMYTAAERKRLFPKASAAVVCSTDGIWNCVGVLPDAHSSYAVLSIDCAPSRAGHGRVVTGGGDNCINIYREETSTTASKEDGGESATTSSDAPKFTIEAVADDAHDGDVNCVKWHPRDGTCLVSCGDDGAVKLWKYRRG